MRLEEFLSYDEASGVLTIHGVRYSRSLFEALGRDGAAVGSTFRIMKRSDGVVTLQTFGQYTHASNQPHHPRQV